MEAFLTMLRSVALFVVMALPGYIFVKTKFLKQEQSGALSKVLTHLGLPFLILSSTLNIDLSLDFIKNTAVLLAVSLLCLVGFFFLSAFLVQKGDEQKKQGMMRFCMIFANNGFLGIPLAQVVFGDSTVVALVSVVGILCNLLMYTVGVYLISGDKNAMQPKKAIFNPVLIAFVAGLILNLVDIGAYIPEVVSYAGYFSGVVTPLSMTILGMKLGGIKLSSLFTSVKSYYVSALKLIVFPVIAMALFLLADLLFQVGDASIYAMFISFATPAATLSSAFADQHDGDIEGAATYTLGSTVLSVLTIPVLYWILCLIV